MYIKIKHIKQFFLIVACIFFAGFNYLTYVNADNAVNTTAIDADKDGLTDEEEKLYGTNLSSRDSDGDGYSDGVEVKSGYNPMKPAPGDKFSALQTNSDGNISTTPINESVTNNFAQEFQAFVASKGDAPISNTDVNDFVAESLAGKVGSGVTLESLPMVDSSQVKILKQDYSGLSENERKSKLQQDAVTYYTKIMYILATNAPRAMVTNSDFDDFQQDFFARLSTLASSNTDSEYFLDLAKRLDLVLNQVNEIAVPESMLEMHVKSVRIVKGFLALRDEKLDTVNDPIAKMALISKIQDLTMLAADYLEIDLIGYFTSIE